MPKQLSVLISVPPPKKESYWHGQASRKLVIGKLNGMGVKNINELAHYVDKDTPDDSYPPIRFLGGQKSFRIVGIGEKGIAILSKFLIYFPEMFDKPIPIRVERQDISASLLESYKPYVARSTAVGNILDWPKIMEGLENNTDDARQWMSQWLDRQLTRQMDFLGMFNAPTPNTMVTKIYVKSLAIIKRELKTKGYARVGLEFISPVDFKGNWAAGRLTSRGHGQIKHVYPNIRPLVATK